MSDPHREQAGSSDFDDRHHDEHAEQARHGDLPYGMAGLTMMLERLQAAAEGEPLGNDRPWSESRCRLVAEYLLSLESEYWMSGEELAYCRRLLAA